VHRRCWRTGCRLRITYEKGWFWLLCPCGVAIARLDQLAARTGYRVDAFCQELEITGRCLQKIFNRDLGLTPSCWLDWQQMVAARRLLVDGWKPGEVARLLGLAHHASFTRKFLRIHGVPPAVFVSMFAALGGIRRDRHSAD